MNATQSENRLHLHTLGHTPISRKPSLTNNNFPPKHRSFFPYLLIAPTLLFVTLFTAWPTLLALYQSFFIQRLNIRKYRIPTFNGVQNYADLFGDETFHQVLLNTFIYIAGTVPVSIALGLFFALLVNRRMRGLGFVRLAFFYPTVLPMVSAATIWLFFFTPDYGIFNTFLRLTGYGGPQNWTANPRLALLATMIVVVWKNAGYYMLFYLAGLQNLPTDVYEAASLDGATAWQQLWQITLPLLRRTTLFISTIALISAFQTVDQIFVLTRGGPSGASTVLLYWLWEVRFEYLNVGQAATITVILILVLLLFTVTNFLLSEQGEERV
ncbi:sugar ABC transporter permease [Chloroflexi bacterium TSY]|nr:sugar ABC transporter permease [Chloroflexi bacterium TSY]